MPRAQREKGKRWERKVAARMRKIFGDIVVRGWQSRSGSDAPDVDCPLIWIECKHRKQVNIKAAMEQAVETTDGRIPVAITKQDKHKPLATMNLEDFEHFLEIYWGWYQDNKC